MPQKKKQHFVPQMYLRNFSVNNDRKNIALYHVPSGRFVKTTGIDTQAYEKYFYGVPELEDALCEIEGAAGPILKQIIATESLPDRKTEDRTKLAFFAFIQAFRTRVAADEADESMESVVKTIASQIPSLAPTVNKVSVKLKNAPAFSMGLFTSNFQLTSDLRYKLLCNRTKRTFITSDHPAVFYNQFLEQKGAVGGFTGLASKGLQLFLPISPKLALIFFDGDTYKVGTMKLTNLKADVIHPSDVDALNVLQAASADSHLYFNQEVTKNDAVRIAAAAAKHRRTTAMTVQENVGIASPDGVELVDWHQKNSIRMSLSLKCISLTPHANAYSLGGKAIHVRNQPICQLNEEFQELARAGKYKFSEFHDFLEDKKANKVRS
ncbi:MAG: DUF4238 domain-containing protein [Gemmataceae bacterium]|nr:DUF4238 domain-containing protein [Gemmataceae bacterium]